MANTLTSLVPTIYSALDVVSRELTGYIPAIRLDAGFERAALNQTVIAFKTPAAAAANITPAQTPPDTGDQTIDNVSLTITKARGVWVRWNGEEQRGVNTGPGYRNILQDQISQAFRTLANEVEGDIALVAKNNASRAVGTSGTAPFGTPGIGDLADAREILVANGAPTSDLQCVLSTTAGAALRKVSNLYKVNEAGSGNLLRQGVLDRLYGIDIRESGQSVVHTAGTGSGATTNNAGYAVGAKTLTLASAGTGTILQGDVVTFASENAGIGYVVGTGDADVSNGGTIVLNDNGLRRAMSAATKAITVSATYTCNSVFARTAIVAATRLPALPEEGDQAIDRMSVTDPVSGLTFEMALYPGFRQMQILVALSWGVGAVKQEHIATIKG